jgi:hypothetical protein
MIVGRYRVQRLLQADLGGRRYLADDTRAAAGAIAVHELFAPALQRDDDRREASSWLDGVLARLRQVQHPALASVVEGWADPAPGGPFYVAQVYVPGPTVADELEESEAIPWRTAVDWALALCDLLSRLHGLQPPYVLGHLRPRHLVLDSRTAAPVVVDLGFAAALAGRPWDNGGYTPLEQYISRPSSRSDIYALGALLYTLLGGHDPDVALAHRLRGGQDLQRALRTLLPPLDHRALGLPPALVALIARATAFGSDDRFQDAASVADALQALLGPAVSTAPSAATAEQEVPVWQQLGLSRDAWFALAPSARNAALLQLMGRRSAPAEATPVAPPPVPAVAPPAAPAAPPSHLRVDAVGHGPYRTIATAIAAAGPGARIEIAAGRYREALRLDRAVELWGPDSGEAVVESHDPPCLVIAAPGVAVRGVAFRHAGDRAAAIECAADALVEHCALAGGTPAIAVRGEGVMLTMRRCSIAEGPGDGVRAGGGATVVLEDCTVAGRGGRGIHLLLGARLDAQRCAVRDSEGAGLVFEAATRGTVEGCEVVGNAGAGVEVAAGGDLIIRACRIGYNGGPAIALGGDGPVTVEDCDLTGNIGGAWQFPDDGADPPAGLVRTRNRE